MPIFGPDGGAGGSGGYTPVFEPPPAAPSHGGGPFINWSSPGSIISSPFRGALAGGRALGGAIEGAGRGLINLPIAGGKELFNAADTGYHDLLHPSLNNAVNAQAQNPGPVNESFQQEVADLSKQQPLTGPFLGSLATTGADFEQIARAAGNTITPGQPFGASVGQLGSGAGLLGRTDYAKDAAQGGPGITSRLINDATNIATLGQPIEGLIGDAAKEATAQAATHGETLAAAQAAEKEATSAAEANVKAAQEQADQAAEQAAQARQAATSGHPVDAAQVTATQQAADTAARALQSAQQTAAQTAAEHANNVSLAQDAVDTTQSHADQLQQHLKAVQTVTKLGSKVANSPFATAEFGAGKLLDLASPIAHSIVGTDLGGKYLQPVIDRAKSAAENMQARQTVGPQRETAQIEKQNIDAQLQRGYTQAAQTLPTIDQPVKRGPLGLFGTKTVPVQDADAHAVALMATTAEGAQLGNLLGRFPRDEAIAIFDHADPNHYTPEQLHLAADVFGPGDVEGKAAEVRDAIPNFREQYAKEGGALDTQNRQYAELHGEANLPAVRPEPGAGAFAQVEHNLTGTSPRIEGLRQNDELQAAYDKAHSQQERVVEKAGKQLTKATAKLGATGLRPDELASPRALMSRLLEAPTVAAHKLVDYGPHVWSALAAAPEKGLARIGQKVLSGKLDPDAAVTDLADQILKLAGKDPDTLSPVALTALEEARQAGMETGAPVPRIGPVGTATAPALRAGRGVERVQASRRQTEQATRDIVRGQTMYGKAMERMGQPTIDRAGTVAAATRKVIAAAQKFADLKNRLVGAAGTAGEAERADLFAHAGVDRKETVEAVRDTRRAVKAQFQAEADALHDELHRMDVPAMKWGGGEKIVRRVNIDKGERKGQMMNARVRKPDTLGLDLRSTVEESGMAHDSRFFRPDGLTPEEIEGHMRGGRGESGQESSFAPGELFDEWLNTVGTIRDLEKAARVGVDKGWDPQEFGRARGEIEHILGQTWGPDVAAEIAHHVAYGPPRDVADAIAPRLSQFVGDEHLAAAQSARAEAVTRALENDRATEEARGTNAESPATRAGRASLDEIGKAQYDQQVAQGKTDVQGSILGQRADQAARAAVAGADTARTQGEREGQVLGQAKTFDQVGNRGVTQGERAQTTGRAITAQAPELQQEAAARVAGPIGTMYREAGKREQNVATAAANYAKETKALDRLDERLVAARQKLEQSVEAAPRPMRPVLELGQRLRDTLTPIADHADREYGEGAGDVYRNAAAEATILSADNMARFGIDPLYLIGEREKPGAINERPPARFGGPVVAKTGQREAGVGLKHATDVESVYRQARSRAFQAIDNETGQHVIDGSGGSLGDMLAARGVQGADQLSHEDLVAKMRDAKLSAWNLSDRRGGLRPDAQVDLDTKVVPTAIWRAWDRYTETKGYEGPGSLFLRGTDKITHTLKQISRLSPRWQVSVTMGHAVMAMVGGGIDPATYFGHDVPAAIRLDRMARTGVRTADDEAWIGEQSPELQRALEQSGGFVPGAVRNRGFVRDQFPAAEADRAKLGDRGAKLQSSLDNMHRTAVWIGQLEKGLDGTGLADFRKAYPDLAHLSDSEIQNEAAIRLSIRTMGDYLNKTPFERNVMSRVVYFYPWLKHITQLAVSTAVHDPLRTAWILHLGAMFDPGPGPLNFLASSYNTGTNKWVTPPSWDPFEALNPVGDNPLGSFNPIVNAAVGGATGFNLGTGKNITRPAGEGGRLGLGELANFAANQSPVIRAARETIPALVPGGGQPLVRYQTGQPIIHNGAFIPSNEQQFPGTNTMMPGALAPLAGLTGLPQQRIINADEITAAELKAEQRNAKSQQSYQRRRRIINTAP